MRSVGRFARSVFQVDTYRAMMDTVVGQSQLLRWTGRTRGTYASFAEAREAIPSFSVDGFHSPASANILEDLRHIYSSDYPVMFWMGRILPRARRIFDFGGHVGLSFYAYQQYLPYPAGLEWTICDVPEAVRVGRELASLEQAEGLHFTTSFDHAEGTDLLLAAGSLQFIEEPLWLQLDGLRNKPAHLVINKVPLSDGASFVTLQNIGQAMCPYRIFNRDEFRNGLEDAGYEIVDEWTNPDLSCSVPHRTVPAFSGMYLTLR